MLADLYVTHGRRPLESNVRSFLFARGKANRGIRDTLIGCPGFFLAYDNGVTAMGISRKERDEVEAFAVKQKVLTSTAQGILRTIRQGRIPSERQAAVVLKLLEQSQRLGYQRVS